MHVHLPSGIVRVLQTFSPDLPVDFVSFEDVIDHVLGARKSEGYMGGGNPLQDQSGQAVVSANLTPDETGLASWSQADFTRAIRTGIRPNNTVLTYPMSPLPELTDADTGAMYVYLRTVPKIHNPMPRPARQSAGVGASQGKQLYYRYGCNSCHSDNGTGVGDLRRAAQDYPIQMIGNTIRGA